MKTPPKHVVCLNFGGIGDQILFSPVLSTVKHALPDTKLTLITEDRCLPVAKLLLQVDQTIPVQVQGKSKFKLFFTLLKLLWKTRPDAIIASGSSPFISFLLWCTDAPLRVGFYSHPITNLFLSHPAPLQLNTYAGQMYYSLATTFLEAIGKHISGIKTVVPQLFVDFPAQEAVKRALDTASESKFERRILVHPGVSKVSIDKNILKAWKPENWAELITRIIKEYPNDQVVLLGGPDDEEAVQQICQSVSNQLGPNHPQFLNFYGQTSCLADLATVISQGDMFVSVDSGPMHLAIGLQIPVVALFSPTNERKLVPKVNWIHTVARNDLECRPCLFDVRQTSCQNPVCLDISVDDTFQALQTALSKRLQPQAGNA